MLVVAMGEGERHIIRMVLGKTLQAAPGLCRVVHVQWCEWRKLGIETHMKRDFVCGVWANLTSPDYTC